MKMTFFRIFRLKMSHVARVETHYIVHLITLSKDHLRTDLPKERSPESLPSRSVMGVLASLQMQSPVPELSDFPASKMKGMKKIVHYYFYREYLHTGPYYEIFVFCAEISTNPTLYQNGKIMFCCLGNICQK